MGGGHSLTSYYLKADRPKLDWSEAENEAQENWQTWKDSFEDDGPFNRMPVVADVHCFQSFLYEYSVSRGFTRKDWLRFRDAACKQGTVSSHKELHDLAFRTLNQGRVPEKMRRSGSMCSKLLSLWRPAQYPMMDSLATRGLQISVKAPRGKGFYSDPDQTFDRFSNGIFAFAGLVADEMNRDISKSSAASNAMRLRIIDNALMRIGRIDLETGS